MIRETKGRVRVGVNPGLNPDKILSFLITNWIILGKICTFQILYIF